MLSRWLGYIGHEINRNIDLYLASINLAGLKALALELTLIQKLEKLNNRNSIDSLH